jgi:hypothetical protein
MNTRLLPLFAEISSDVPDWEEKFEKLIQERGPIRYRHDKIPAVPERFEKLPVQQRDARYFEATFELGQGEHFLIPL